MELEKIERMTLAEMKEYAKKEGLKGVSLLRKKELLEVIKAHIEEQEPREAARPHKPHRRDAAFKKQMSKDQESAEGMLEIMNDGFGFLRRQKHTVSDDDIYISASQIRRFNLRTGDMVSGQIRPPKDNERYHALLFVEAINGGDPESAARRPLFGTLTPIHPKNQLKLETSPTKYSTRIMDLLIPIGKGQRGLIVSPPKAGKTMLLKEIANSISTKMCIRDRIWSGLTMRS